MDPRKIRSLLEDALEAEVPSGQIQLWPAVKRLVAGKPIRRQGAKMYPQLIRRVSRAVILTVFVLFALVLFTAQGRSFAQGLIQFFSPAKDTSFPLPDSQLAVATDHDLSTAEPPSPLLSVAEAEKIAGFDAAELSYVPEGLTYLGARLYGKTINIEYETPGHESHLSISQSQTGYMESAFGSVPAEYVVPVMIGDLAGEFAQGTFVVYPEATSATWNPEFPIRRLRWTAGGMLFEIQAVEVLDQAGLIALAEDLMGQ
jgi:hypothetical protein